MSPTKIDIMRLGLVGKANQAAIEIASSHPDIQFTSGRRDLQEQAAAMAQNVVQNRNWIIQTYKPSKASQKCQAWVTTNPKAKTPLAIMKGLLEVLRALPEDEIEKLSKHLTGEAFDIKPIDGLKGQMVLASLRLVVAAHGGQLLEREGGLVRWHAQF